MDALQEALTNNYPGNSGNIKQSKESQFTFDQYLTQWEQHIKRTYPSIRKLTEMAVTMNVRNRGLTISDMVSAFGTRRSTDGRWIEYNPDAAGEVHPINIVQPALRANTNACLQSSPVIEISSANQSAQHKQIAMKWQNVADYFERFDWDEDSRTVLFDGLQKTGIFLTEVVVEPCGTAPAMTAVGSDGGMAIFECLECGQSGMTQEKEAMCPKCGEPVEAQMMSEIDVKEQKVPMYDIVNKLVPFWNIAIDRQNAANGGLKAAKWLQIHELVDRPTLSARYPNQLFTTNANEWNYQLRCAYGLANADQGFFNWRPSSIDADDQFDFCEVRNIYLHESAYADYYAPGDYQFVDGEGKKIFSIRKGQTITEAWYDLYKENPEGIKFVWEGQRLLDICDPREEVVNFRKKFSDTHWLRDSTSYFSSPNYSIVTIQDDITLLNTMNHNIAARNSVIPVYYNSKMFDEASFSKEYIGTSNEALMEDTDIRSHVTQLPIPAASPALMNQMTFLWEIKDSVSQVQPALRGEQQKGETYGAQRQQLEQSYGLLSSVLKSYAGMRVENFKQKAEMASRYWTLEQFQRVGSMFGEVWTEEDVEQMTGIDFAKDLVVSYQNGSEMPQTNLGREMKFFNGLGQLMPFLQMAPNLIDQDKLTKILAKIDEYSDFDFDLTGLEVNELIAQKQIIELQSLCQEMYLTFEQVEQARQQIVGVDPTDVDPETGQPQPITALDIIVEQIFDRSQIQFSQYEDLPQQKAFFIEQLRGEKGKIQPNYLLLAVLTYLIDQLDGAIQQQQQDAMESDPQVQMAREQQQAEAQAQKDAESAKMQADAQKEQSIAEREVAIKQLEAQNESESRAAEFVQDMALQDAQDKNELAKIALQGEVNAKSNDDEQKDKS